MKIVVAGTEDYTGLTEVVPFTIAATSSTSTSTTTSTTASEASTNASVVPNTGDSSDLPALLVFIALASGLICASFSQILKTKLK